MEGMQQLGNGEFWPGWRLCFLFRLPDLHHSRELKPLGRGRGALERPLLSRAWPLREEE